MALPVTVPKVQEGKKANKNGTQKTKENYDPMENNQNKEKWV